MAALKKITKLNPKTHYLSFIIHFYYIQIIQYWKKRCYYKLLGKNETSLNNSKISHIVSFHILYSFRDKDLQPDDGQVKRAETCSHLKLHVVKINHTCSSCVWLVYSHLKKNIGLCEAKHCWLQSFSSIQNEYIIITSLWRETVAL